MKCEDIGDLSRYIRCKIKKYQKGKVVQSMKVEFDMPEEVPPTTAKPDTILTKCMEEEALDPKNQTNYGTGIGKLQHLVKNSWPDIANAVCKLPWQLVHPTKPTITTMRYIVATLNRGIVLKPTGRCDGKEKTLNGSLMEGAITTMQPFQMTGKVCQIPKYFWTSHLLCQKVQQKR